MDKFNFQLSFDHERFYIDKMDNIVLPKHYGIDTIKAYTQIEPHDPDDFTNRVMPILKYGFNQDGIRLTYNEESNRIFITFSLARFPNGYSNNEPLCNDLIDPLLKQLMKYVRDFTMGAVNYEHIRKWHVSRIDIFADFDFDKSINIDNVIEGFKCIKYPYMNYPSFHGGNNSKGISAYYPGVDNLKKLSNKQNSICIYNKSKQLASIGRNVDGNIMRIEWRLRQKKNIMKKLKIKKCLVSEILDRTTVILAYQEKMKTFEGVTFIEYSTAINKIKKSSIRKNKDELIDFCELLGSINFKKITKYYGEQKLKFLQDRLYNVNKNEKFAIVRSIGKNSPNESISDKSDQLINYGVLEQIRKRIAVIETIICNNRYIGINPDNIYEPLSLD
ncbi:MAG: hypothetical protein ACLFSQ_08185 [Candidatus Zixiibacteriota bacterium]